MAGLSNEGGVVETERTRELIAGWMEAQGSRDPGKMAALLAEDARVLWPVGAPIAGFEGRDDVVDGFASGRGPKALGVVPATMSVDPHRIVVDGSTAVVEFTLTAATESGGTYENRYAFFYQFNDDGLLAEIREYGDTLNAARQLPNVFAHKLGEIQ